MDFQRLFDILPYQQRCFPNKRALAIRQGVAWQFYSTAEAIRLTQRLSAGWLHLGLRKGDRVAILAERASPRWLLIDISLMQAGFIPVPIHSSCLAEELRYILKESGARYAVAANREALEKVLAERAQLPALEEAYCLQELPDYPGWEDLQREPTPAQQEQLQVLKAAIHEDDLATIVYTSGTAGEPKGVMLSHANIVSNIKAVISLVPVDRTKRALSFLPPSHIFERMANYAYLASGASIYYSHNPEETRLLLRSIKPHFFTAVPRLLERAYDSILERIGQLPAPMRWLGLWAVRTGEQYKDKGAQPAFYALQLALARLLVLRRWRRLLGGRVQGVLVGAAALQPRLGRLFSAAGIPIREGYGMTETSPVISFNRFEPGGARFGTVGIPLPGVEVRIGQHEEGPEGEIQVKGPGVMLGYYQRPEATQEAFTPDGWLRTGDRGQMVHKRFLQITGRQKDLFKTSNGKYIAPEEIEALLRLCPYIEDCLVIGARRPFVSALLLPQFELLYQWAQEEQIHWTAPQYMVHNPKVMDFLRQQVREANRHLPAYKQVGNIHLLYEPWTAASGTLTPTLKLRREWLAEKHQKDIDRIYEQGADLRG